ncbi:MAG: D-cysteine desulfhydrase family protein [Peptostreptococcaceae bacterium]|nr:D-cysteine desulfhydrase family protein [Peptostreptococcaceae bacterium]
MLLGKNKISFLHLPTPLDHLDNISEDLGIDLYIKRDDMLRLGMGGNKLRKLEYLAKEAINQGATMLITEGGAQTNHGRLTAAVAAKLGLKCAIVTADKYPGEISSNLLLDGMMNCPVYFKAEDGLHSQNERFKMCAEEVIAKYESEGETVYFIPLGGSNELGTLGYYECSMELTRQAKDSGIENALIVTTVGSMGTYMGLAVGLENENSKLDLLGIAVMPYPNGIDTHAAKYLASVNSYFGINANPEFNIRTDYDRGAYNNPVKEVRDAMYYMAKKEAIILDPCYTGKAFAGLLDMIKKGEIPKGSSVIFLHTGGQPGINTPHHRVEMEKDLDNYIHII